jgi:hypothetical protein
MSATPPPSEPLPALPIDGPSAGRALGGGIAGVLGLVLAVAGPVGCVYAAAAGVRSATMESGVVLRTAESTAHWMTIAFDLELAGMVLAALGLVVVVTAPARVPAGAEADLARSTRAAGSVATWLGVPIAVLLVGWVSESSRAIAAAQVLGEAMALVPAMPGVGLPAGVVASFVLGAVAGAAYLAAAVGLLPIARGLRLGKEDAPARAARWAKAATTIVAADLLATLAAWAAAGSPLVGGLVRVAMLAPWPVLVWVRARGWTAMAKPSDPEA